MSGMTQTAQQFIRRIAPWLDDARLSALHVRLEALASDTSLRDGLLPGLLDGEGRLCIAGASLEFPNHDDAWVILREVFERQEYWFAPEGDRCRVIDGGAHCGLAVAFFKALRPDAVITAIEPRAELAAMLARNIERNNWGDVEVVEAAIAPDEGEAVMHAAPGRTMSGTLTDRLHDRLQGLKSTPIRTIPLRAVLDGPIDLLKLDIEGMESPVLRGSASALEGVRRVFVEVHGASGRGLPGLGGIITCLEDAGMHTMVARSMGSERRAAVQPFGHLDDAPSVLVYGSRPEAAAVDRAARAV